MKRQQFVGCLACTLGAVFTVAPVTAQRAVATTRTGVSSDALVNQLTSESTPSHDAANPLTTTVTVDLDGVSLRRAVLALAHAASVRIQYQDALLDAETHPVTLHVKNVALGTALDRILNGKLQVIVLGRNVVHLDAATDKARVVEGGITGTVTDTKTGKPLSSARVTLDDQPRGVLTDDKGRYTLTGVKDGEHKVVVRLVGYTRQVRTVTVTDGAQASADFGLTPGVNTLDQVVVSGSVIPQEIKRIPNAITVITAKQLEERNITHIDQLFHGDVPGVFALNRGSDAMADGQVQMNVRGSSEPYGGEWGQDLLKVYVDGVQMTDPQFFNQIDPRTIDHIEILTGPQATTIYGSTAMNGVMQVFTKRGTSNRPLFTVTAISGLVQNNVTTNLTPQHDVSAQVTGLEGEISYSVGATLQHIAPWTPAIESNTTGWNGGVRYQRGMVTLDYTGRQSYLTNTDQGIGAYAADLWRGLQASGYFGASASHLPVQRFQTATDSKGLTAKITPTTWWSNELVGGIETTDYGTHQNTPGFNYTGDTLVFANNTEDRLVQLRYLTTLNLPLTSFLTLQTTAGADNQKRTSTVSGGSRAAGQSGLIYPYGSFDHTHTTGAFVQAQFGLFDQLFLTYGLRADYDPHFGVKDNPNVTPRIGAAYTREVGDVTFKLRGAYGRSTRTPQIGQKDGADETYPPLIGLYGAYKSVRPNPAIGPEFKSGGEGGLEVNVGSRSSFVLTRYNETVDNLIYFIFPIDSVRSLRPIIAGQDDYLWDSKDAQGYGYHRIGENLNAAAIRNQGWEFQTSNNFGPLVVKGTYTFSKSRNLALKPLFRELLPWAPLGNTVIGGGLTEHTWMLGFNYARRNDNIGVTLNGIGQVYHYDTDPLCGYRLTVGANANCSRVQDTRGIVNGGNFLVPAYVMSYINAAHRFNAMWEGIFSMDNAGNSYVNDRAGRIQVQGRVTKVGFRLRT